MLYVCILYVYYTCSICILCNVHSALLGPFIYLPIQWVNTCYEPNAVIGVLVLGMQLENK